MHAHSLNSPKLIVKHGIGKHFGLGDSSPLSPFSTLYASKKVFRVESVGEEVFEKLFFF